MTRHIDPAPDPVFPSRRAAERALCALRTRVRTRDARYLQCACTARRCRAAGLDASHEFQQASSRCIVASASLDGARVAYAIEVSAWLAEMYGEDAQTAFDAMPSAYLLAMVERDTRARTMRLGRYTLTDWQVHGIEDRPASIWAIVVRNDTGLALTVRTSPECMAQWCTARIEHTRTAGAGHSRWIDRVPVALALCVGRSRVSFATLMHIACGDVLIVQTADWQACVGQHRVGSFAIQEGVWKMESVEEQPFDRAQAPDIDGIPIELEFVLHRMSVTVGALRAMDAGTTFPLAPAAFVRAAQDEAISPDGPDDDPVHRYCVHICANGRRIGEGELVALESGLAVEITCLDDAQPGRDTCKAISV